MSLVMDLGTGYIVTAIKAIIRDLTQQDESLESIFRSVNDFLIRKYGGNEFMTLLGGILDTKKGKIHLCKCRSSWFDRN
jgi:serine phosphatase RsbU (regulator of sigma subunit)